MTTGTDRRHEQGQDAGHEPKPAGARRDGTMRAITKDGAFRVIVCRTTETTAGAIAAQGAEGNAATLLAELMTGVILVRETMAPSLRLQASLKMMRGGSIHADSHPNGLTRGLVRGADDGTPIVLGSSTQLHVSRLLPGARLHQGIVDTGGADGISGALTSYMLNSEQVYTTVGVRAVGGERDEERASGGFVVQLLPEADEEALASMIARLERVTEQGRVTALLESSDFDPEDLLDELLEGEEFVILDESPVHHGCNCSPVRVLGAMATLGEEEIQEIVDDGGFLDVQCDYCGTDYRIGSEQLRSLLEQS